MRFFDFDKVQKDFLTAALKASKTGGMCNWFTGGMESDKKTILSDGHFAAFVPDDLLFVKRAGDMREISGDTFKKNLMPEKDLQTVIDTGMQKKIDKDTICILKNEHGEEIWVNEKYMKYFAGMDCHYKGTDKKHPVQVFCIDVLVGIILPITHN